MPGLLFAILSLPGFLLFSIWLCMQCGGQPPRRHTAPGQAQFIGSSKQVQTCREEACCSCCPAVHSNCVACLHMYRCGPGNVYPVCLRLRLQTALPPGAPPPATAPRRSRRGLACKVALLLAALALAGLSGWGMAQSIQATDSTVSDFWGIVEQVEGKVRRRQRGYRAPLPRACWCSLLPPASCMCCARCDAPVTVWQACAEAATPPEHPAPCGARRSPLLPTTLSCWGRSWPS